MRGIAAATISSQNTGQYGLRRASLVVGGQGAAPVRSAISGVFQRAARAAHGADGDAAAGDRAVATVAVGDGQCSRWSGWCGAGAGVGHYTTRRAGDTVIGIAIAAGQYGYGGSLVIGGQHGTPTAAAIGRILQGRTGGAGGSRRGNYTAAQCTAGAGTLAAYCCGRRGCG
ncbi:MAG: hypothetical protein RIR11_1288 [Bacteroidota bacterium]